MTAASSLTDLLLRLGAELDFDVARDVVSARGGSIDVVWLDRCLPLAAVCADPLDLRHAPVVPVVAFDVRIAAMLETDELAATIAHLESTGAPLRVLAIGRDSRHSALAPILQSVDQMHRQDDDEALRTRIAATLNQQANSAGRTIVMLQHELTEWARHLRDVKPRSYSAESLFKRTGVID
ncbi:MAG: hypothetical protein ACREPX_11195 [Rhodanobacteraceae bacterium]